MGFHNSGHNQSWSFTRVVATEYRPANPQIKKNLETHEKKKEGILQKVVRYYFFSQSRSKKPFFLCGGGGVGEIKLLFKHYLALFVVSIVTKYRFFND